MRLRHPSSKNVPKNSPNFGRLKAPAVGNVMNINIVTFHKDVYLPDDLSIQVDKLIRRMRPLRYGMHSLQAAVHDRYGFIPNRELPTELVGCELIEVEVQDGMPSKVVMRRKMQDGRWLVLVVGDDGFVRTVWSNRPDDTHATLRRERYAQRTVDETPKRCETRP
jgi:hypothetical protein